jgi:chromosome segregation ATPase
MELDQILKRLDWMDDERRKEKAAIAAMEERLLSIEGKYSGLPPQIQDLNSDLVRLMSVFGRLEAFEASLAQARVEFNRTIEGIEKQRTERDREVEKMRRAELEGINKAISEVRKGLDPIPEIRKTLQARQDEEFRLSRLIEEVDKKVVDTKRYDEEYKRSLRLVEEGRRQDAKRLTDLVGEVASVRKRVDEQRGKVDLTADGLRKFETRLVELQAAESERRQAQSAFIEKQTMGYVERERTWKEWQERFVTVEKMAAGLDVQIQALDSIQRSVKKSQDALDDVTQRFDRRINEITEMQRLSDDRFRQEWVTFKADDQKRWTNYTLAQEEQQRDMSRQFGKVSDRLMTLEGMSQELADRLQQGNEETEKRLQGLVGLAHEWISAYENAFGRTR